MGAQSLEFFKIHLTPRLGRRSINASVTRAAPFGKSTKGCITDLDDVRRLYRNIARAVYPVLFAK